MTFFSVIAPKDSESEEKFIERLYHLFNDYTSVTGINDRIRITFETNRK